LSLVFSDWFVMRSLISFALLALLCLSAFANLEKYQQRKSREFHEKKGKEEGVKTLASGVQYKVLNKGTGKSHPGPSDQVKVHYAGTLTDGKEFDSSYGRGDPATFGVNQVIAGWTEVLQLMVIGDKWEVFIPWEKAYGARGSPPRIPGYSSLIFTVELLGINDKEDL